MTDDYIDTPEKAAARLKKIRLLLTEADIPIVGDYRDREIEYIDTAPPRFEVKIDLVEFFERITRFKADAWQRDFCNRLQAACVNRHIERAWATVHAQGQLGKSKILAQLFAAWIFGHDPMHRFALATYNVTRSQSHSKAVIDIMNLPIYKEIFRDPAGWVKKGTAVSGWQTQARKDSTESQFSFNPVGLQSGLTGSGFDTLVIDDPYADQKEAFSETVRTNLQEFWDFTVGSRMSLYANVFAMFHRYHVQDLAGYLLDTGDFDYWRYSAICDGPYVHEETGIQYADPLNRAIGDLVSPDRFPLAYYVKPRQNTRVWNSMFQGKPTSDSGDFFNISRIKVLRPIEDAELIESRRRECVAFARAWDNAATDDGGDTTAGMGGGITPEGRLLIEDTVLEQVDSGGRLALQRQTAESDGRDVTVLIPQDPGSAGKDVVFMTEQALEGFTVVKRPTSANKEVRATPASAAVNMGMVEIVEGPNTKRVLTALRDFPLSDFDDPVDALSDLYNYLYEVAKKGLVVKNLSPQRNLVTWDTFGKYYGPKGDDQQPLSEIPKHWTIYVGVKITPEASKANSAIIVARAAQNAKLPDTLFIVAEYKKFDANYEAVFEWIDAALEAYCGGNKNAMIWLHADSEQYRQTIAQKLKRAVLVFEGDDNAGLTELNWYLKPNGKDHPFSEIEKEGANLYGLIADGSQLMAATDEYGLYAVRQECSTWGFNDKGEPSAVGSVLDCLSMICYAFRTSETGLTLDEKVEEVIKVKSPNLSVTAIAAIDDRDQRDTATTKRMMEEKRIRQELNAPVRGAHAGRFARR